MKENAMKIEEKIFCTRFVVSFYRRDDQKGCKSMIPNVWMTVMRRNFKVGLGGSFFEKAHQLEAFHLVSSIHFIRR